MAAVLATLEAIEADEMIANAASAEAYLRKMLDGMSGVVAVHGKGCLIGIEFDGPCSPVHAKLVDQKIITGTSSSPNVLRLLPPLCVTQEELAAFVEALR